MKKVLSILAAAILVLGLSAPAFAQGEPAAPLCAHHTAHDTACGYREGAEEQPCTFAHTHDAACGYAEATAGAPCDIETAHTHDETCGYNAEAGAGCAFAHAHDGACTYTEAIEAAPCAVVAAHVHDDACGFAEAVDASPCGYRCALCATETVPVAAPAANLQGGVPGITVNTTVIAFAGHEWVVIGDGNSGVFADLSWELDTSITSYATLLLKNGDIGNGYNNTSKFNTVRGTNEYNMGEVYTAMQGIYSGFAASKEQSLVVPRILNEVAVNDSGTRGILPEPQFVWPLSDVEWTTISGGANGTAALSFDSGIPGRGWWLRSPYAYIYVYNGNPNGTLDTHGNSTSGDKAIRPAFNLNLSPVIFTSSAQNGKPAAASPVLGPVLAPGAPIKFTMQDDSLTCDAEVTAVSGNDITFSYAISGSCNRLSAIVKDASANVTFYGNLAANPGASGTATLTVPDGLAESDTLLVFAEQVNADYYTDFASVPAPVATSAPAGLSGMGCTTSANSDGKITGTTPAMEYSLDRSTWTRCGDTEITGLAPGTYYVRYPRTVNGVLVWPQPLEAAVTIERYTPPVGSSPVSTPGGAPGSTPPPESISAPAYSNTIISGPATSNSIPAPAPTSATSAPAIPQTGDNAPIGAFAASIASLGAIAGALVLWKKRW